MEVILQKHYPVTIVERCNEDGIVTWLLKYYLQTYPNLSTDGKGRFGIKIARHTPDGAHDKTAETCAITDDFNEAMAMIKYFSKGTVCPYTLDGMAEEWNSCKALCGNGIDPWSLPNLYTHYAG